MERRRSVLFRGTAAVFFALLSFSAGRSPAAPAEQNWIKVSPTGRYLMFEDGSPFIPLGVSMNGDHIQFDYLGETEIAGERYVFDGDHFEKLFKKMKASGENFLRIDIEGTTLMPRPDIKRLIKEKKIQFLESPAGSFNEEYARRVDRLVSLARKYGIYLDLVLITHTCDVTAIARNLDLYPYHKANGGPLGKMDDLLTDSRARSLWLARMKYISDRWGHSRNIAAWELYNEILNCGCSDLEAAAAWVAEMGSALRSYELEKWGKAHPVIVSGVDLVPRSEFLLKSPGTDIAVTHLYLKSNNSGNPVEASRPIRPGVLKNLSSLDYSRPFLENERTLGYGYPERFQKEMEHYAAWSYMASGAASPGATWSRMGAWGAFRTADLVHDMHKAMSEVLKKIDWASFASRPAEIGSADPEVLAYGISDGGTVFGWLFHDNPADYDMDILKAWFSGEIKEPRVFFQMINKWRNVSGGYAGEEVLAPYIKRLAGLMVKYGGITEEQAGKRLEEIFGDAAKARGLALKISAHREKKNIVADLKRIFGELREKLAKTESELGIFKKKYRGYPPVTTEVKISGLREGRYLITWYDDDTGKPVKEERASGPELVLKSPPFSKHTAFIITGE